jgi:hypothetical protein
MLHTSKSILCRSTALDLVEYYATLHSIMIVMTSVMSGFDISHLCAPVGGDYHYPNTCFLVYFTHDIIQGLCKKISVGNINKRIIYCITHFISSKLLIANDFLRWDCLINYCACTKFCDPNRNIYGTYNHLEFLLL